MRAEGALSRPCFVVVSTNEHRIGIGLCCCREEQRGVFLSVSEVLVWFSFIVGLVHPASARHFVGRVARMVGSIHRRGTVQFALALLPKAEV